MKKLRDNLAVVTGASSGIGLQFCHRLASKGCNLVMISNQERELKEASALIMNQYDVRTYPVCLDLTDPEALKGLEIFLDASKLKPEILINNAGIFSFNTIADTSEQKINAFIDLHVRAVTLLSRTFARRFAMQGRGWILNMSSMSCWMPMPGIALYAATKAYIRVFSRSLHYEMKDSKVRVMVACPGGIATDLFGLPPNLRRLALRLHAIQTPEKFTAKALRKLFSGKAQYINGWINRIAILFIGIMPPQIRMLVKSEMLDKNIRRP